MVATVITVTVGPDGAIRLPADTVKPGETVTLRIDRVNPDAPRANGQQAVRLTKATATTPELREEFIQQVLARGRRNREQLPEGQRSSNHDWLYGEDGLPR